MFKLIFWGLVIYLLYRFISEVVVPVSRASTQLRDKIREAQRQMEEQQKQQAYRQQQFHQQQEAREREAKPSVEKDYIDFEEIKP